MQLPVRLLTTGMAVTMSCRVIRPPPRCLSPVMRFTPGRTPLSGINRTTIRYGKVERRSLLGRDLSSDVDVETTSSVALAMSVSPGSRVREVVVEPAFTNLLGIMAASGAFLGPNLDNYHSAFGVLTYKNPVVLSVAGHVLITTDWWVPPLFAVAGAGIGALYILFDAVLGTPAVKRAPEWKNVFLAISLFSFQYYLSGLLVANGFPYWLLVTCLAILAERAFKLFDDTRAGLIVSLATAVLGPLIEVMLVNVLGLYVYNGADVLGVDSWIPVVYFCGGPAVGSLARAVHAQLRASSGAEY